MPQPWRISSSDEFEGQEAGGLLELTWGFCNDNQGPDLRLTFTN